MTEPEVKYTRSETWAANMGHRCGRIYIVKDYGDNGRLVRVECHAKKMKGGACGITILKTLCDIISVKLRNGASPEKLARESLIDVTCGEDSSHLECGYKSCVDALGWLMLD